MAGILEEFDDATPLRGTYCSRVTTEQYEEQGSQCTGQALEELIDHLSQNPDAYRRVMKRKRRQEAEEAGLLSFMKVLLVLSHPQTNLPLSYSHFDPKLGERGDMLHDFVLCQVNSPQSATA